MGLSSRHEQDASPSSGPGTWARPCCAGSWPPGGARRGRLVASHPKAGQGGGASRRSSASGSKRPTARPREAADIVILAVKPQILDSVLAEIRPAVSRGRLVDLDRRRDFRRRGSRPRSGTAWPSCARCRTWRPWSAVRRPCSARAGTRGRAAVAEARQDLRVDRPRRRASGVSARRGHGPLRQRADVRLPDHRGLERRRRARRDLARRVHGADDPDRPRRGDDGRAC